MDILHENSNLSVLIPIKLLHHSSLTAILQLENPNCKASLISYMSFSFKYSESLGKHKYLVRVFFPP